MCEALVVSEVSHDGTVDDSLSELFALSAAEDLRGLMIRWNQISFAATLCEKEL